MLNHQDSTSDQFRMPILPMALIALCQGLALLLLHRATTVHFWPHNEPQWLFYFYTIAIVSPLSLLLGLTSRNYSQLIKFVLGFSLIAAGLAYYTGQQTLPLAQVGYQSSGFFFVSSMLIASFKALIYSQQYSSGIPFSYARLFTYSWRNAITLALSLLFTACFWGLLQLWVALFEAIEIDFFAILFGLEWFYYPALCLANGFGIFLFREHSEIIDTITRIQQTAFKYLLLILVFVCLSFLLALPFSGLASLWQNGGSNLLLAIQGLLLFFVNAVYQDEPDKKPFGLVLHRFVSLGIATLPVLSALIFYGLSLRIEQYGWSLDRCWGMLTWSIFSLFSVAYLVSILRQRDNWLVHASWINVRMGLLVLALMLAVNSPLLNFRVIVAESQMARFIDESTNAADFDLYYFQYKLGRAGYNELNSYADTHQDEFADRIRSSYLLRDQKQRTEAEIEIYLRSRLAIKTSQQISNEAEAQVLIHLRDHFSESSGGNNGHSISQYYLLDIDLLDENAEQYLLLREDAYWLDAKIIYFENNQWHSNNLQYDVYPKNTRKTITALVSGNFKVSKPKWQEIEVLGRRLKVLQEE